MSRRPGARRSIYKSPAQLRLMVEPGKATAAALKAVSENIRVGITTLELDAIAEKAIRDYGGAPNFMLQGDYKHTICANVNEDVVHAIPSDRALQPGDMISVDVGAVIKGWNGDAAATFIIPDPERPELTARQEKLSRVTHDALWHGIARLAKAKYLNEVGESIAAHVRKESDFGIVEEYIGHGIGRSMHEAPPVFNYPVEFDGPEVKPGLVVAIEPIISEGKTDTIVQPDGWTVTMADGKMSCQWEHSVAVHKNGIWVLTADDGGAKELAGFGITPQPIP